MAFREREGEIRLIRSNAAHLIAFRSLLALMSCGVVTLTAALLMDTQWPDPRVLIPLLVLAAVAAHREVLFGDETALSGSMIVVSAAIVAFGREGQALGPLLCGFIAGLHWAQIRARTWSRVAINSAATALAAAGGTAAFASARALVAAPGALAVGLPSAVLVYWIVNNLLVAAAMSAFTGNSVVVTFSELVRSETQMLGFAVLGGMCGLLFLDVGVWAGVLGLVALLAAVDVFAIRRPRPSIVWTAWSSRALLGRAVLIAGAVGAGWLTTRAGGPVVGFVVGLLVASSGAFVNVLLRLRRRLGIWDTVASLGVVIADAHLAVIAATGGVVAAEVGVVAATLVVVVAAAVVAALGARLRRRRAAPSEDEALVLAAVDLALLDHFDARSPR